MKIVTIGGGTGGSIIDQALSGKYKDLTAIVTSFDDGGSSGEIRRIFGTLPHGDIRRRIFAQKNIEDEVLEKLYNFRFEKHSFGNLMILAASKIWGEKKGIENICKLFKIKGKVLPVTYSHAELVAEMENGEKVFGEHLIGQGKHENILHQKIRKIFLNKKTILNKDVEKEILLAKYIILCPGDFYTSLIPNFLVPGFTKTVKKAIKNGAKIIFICNIMTKFSETHNFKLSDFVCEVEKYLGNKVDYIVFNKSKISKRLLEKYKKEESAEVVFNDLKKRDSRVLEVNLLKENGYIRHDPKLFLKAYGIIVNICKKK